MFKKLDDILEKYGQLSAEMADPAVIAQPERWTQCAKEHADIAETAEKYLEYKKVEREMEEDFAAAEAEEDREMKDLLTQEGYACKEKLAAIRDELRILLLPKDKNDDRSVVMEIRGGAGGEEASLFAADLYNMYCRYAESMRWRTEVVERNETELGGMKEIVFSVSGKGVYSKLKYESGVHRVQRVPRRNRRQDPYLHRHRRRPPRGGGRGGEDRGKGPQIDTYRSGGAGGQHITRRRAASASPTCPRASSSPVRTSARRSRTAKRR